MSNIIKLNKSKIFQIFLKYFKPYVPILIKISIRMQNVNKISKKNTNPFYIFFYGSIRMYINRPRHNSKDIIFMDKYTLPTLAFLQKYYKLNIYIS